MCIRGTPGLIFELLTGRYPFYWLSIGGSTPDLKYYRGKLNGESVLVDAARNRVGLKPWSVSIDAGNADSVRQLHALEKIMEACLHADSSQRPTVEDVLAALSPASAGSPCSRLHVPEDTYTVPAAV